MKTFACLSAVAWRSNYGIHARDVGAWAKSASRLEPKRAVFRYAKRLPRRCECSVLDVRLNSRMT
jgi:hypothetical protein